MKELNIGKIIVAKRREKGPDPGRSGRLYRSFQGLGFKVGNRPELPDITLLPQLGAYFNISIDELMGYSPS